jgi:hypothetical protein
MAVSITERYESQEAVVTGRKGLADGGFDQLLPSE